MATHFDLPVSELRTYRPDLPVPADLRQFWLSTLDDATSYPLDVTGSVARPDPGYSLTAPRHG